MAQWSQPEIPQSSEVAAWVARMSEVPDLLVTAKVSLTLLAKDPGPAVAVESRRIIGEACDLLDLALAHVLEFTRNLPDLAALSEGLASAERRRASDRPPVNGGAVPRQ